MLHQVHYDEAVRRLQEAVFQLINTGRDGDSCLTRLAQRILERLGQGAAQAKSLRELGRLRVRTRQEAQRLLHRLTKNINIQILDDGGEPSRKDMQCPHLSYEDLLLVELAEDCHTIVSNDNGVVNCCLSNTGNPAKCVKP